jgi:hypothetical protein
MTPPISDPEMPAAARTDRIAFDTPPVTSAVVPVLIVASTSLPRRSAASVLVPPTSTPIRIIPVIWIFLILSLPHG